MHPISPKLGRNVQDYDFDGYCKIQLQVVIATDQYVHENLLEL